MLMKHRQELVRKTKDHFVLLGYHKCQNMQPPCSSRTTFFIYHKLFHPFIDVDSALAALAALLGL